MLKKTLAIFINPWFFKTLGFLLLALFILLAGPYFSFGEYEPLKSFVARAVLVLIVGLSLFLPNFWRRLSELAGGRHLLQWLQAFLRGDAHSPGIKTMTSHFEAGIRALKPSLFKNKSLYDVPWYLVIGRTGSGKTTALMNSGLEFPLERRCSTAVSEAVDSTLYCDWWFAQGGVLIDTAGRYVLQDRDQQTDKKEWLYLIKLLRKHRRRRPINGVVLTVNIMDIVNVSQAERLKQAYEIKQRMQELRYSFGTHLPVYVLVTKLDLLFGFVEFFENLSAEQRQQVWGVTFNQAGKEQETELAVQAFSREFDLLIERLNQCTCTRLHDEPDEKKRSKIFGFPQQLAVHKVKLNRFLRDIFVNEVNEKGVKDATELSLRGVYFISSTQEATSFDRFIEQAPVRSEFAQTKCTSLEAFNKSYFIHDLYKKVIFKEAGLVGVNPRLERHRHRLRYGACAVFLSISCLSVCVWIWHYLSQVERIEQFDRWVESSKSEWLHFSEKSNSSEQDVVAWLRSVNLQLTDLEATQAGNGLARAWHPAQYNKLADAVQYFYENLLFYFKLPQVKRYLEDHLQDEQITVQARYEALKAYLMLGLNQYYDANFILNFFQNSSRVSQLMSEQDLKRLSVAYSARRPIVHINDTLIEQIRTGLLNDETDEQWLYGHVKKNLEHQLKHMSVPEFSVYSVAGELDATKVFVRQSGASLRQGISALFSQKKGYRLFFSEAPGQVRELLKERQWVLYDTSLFSKESVYQQAFVELEKLYFKEYVNNYRSLLEDTVLAPVTNPQQAKEMLALVSDTENSPLLKLLKAVRNETQLTSFDKWAEGVLSYDTIDEYYPTQPVQRFHEGVSRNFMDLDSFVQNDQDQPAQLDTLLGSFGELQKYFDRVLLEKGAGTSIPEPIVREGEHLATQLKLGSDEAPAFVKGLLDSLSERTVAIANSGRLAQINTQWQAESLRFCKGTVMGRYPFVKNSKNYVQLNDFNQFFSYSGMLNSFFNEYLISYVETAFDPWSNKASAAKDGLNLSENALAFFQQAQEIRRAFFPFNEGQASVSFRLTPLKMDKDIGSLWMNIEGQVIQYDHSAPRMYSLTWPGQKPELGIVLKLNLLDNKSVTLQVKEGPWALFHFFQKAAFRPGESAEQFSVDLQVEARVVKLYLTALSVHNPFEMFKTNKLAGFNCPEQL